MPPTQKGIPVPHDKENEKFTMAELMDGPDQPEKKPYPFGTKYHWYNYNDNPVRQADETTVPEVLNRKADGWVFFGIVKLLEGEAEPISQEEFDRLVAEKMAE